MITTPTCSQRRLKTHTADAADVVCVTTVTVVAAGMSNMTAASAGNVNRGELASQPRLRPAPVLENVPGLIVTQHSGEGTANQYFLGASTLDHNTDLATGAINAIGNFDTGNASRTQSIIILVQYAGRRLGNDFALGTELRLGVRWR